MDPGGAIPSSHALEVFIHRAGSKTPTRKSEYKIRVLAWSLRADVQGADLDKGGDLFES